MAVLVKIKLILHPLMKFSKNKLVNDQGIEYYEVSDLSQDHQER